MYFVGSSIHESICCFLFLDFLFKSRWTTNFVATLRTNPPTIGIGSPRLSTTLGTGIGLVPPPSRCYLYLMSANFYFAG